MGLCAVGRILRLGRAVTVMHRTECRRVLNIVHIHMQIMYSAAFCLFVLYVRVCCITCFYFFPSIIKIIICIGNLIFFFFIVCYLVSEFRENT